MKKIIYATMILIVALMIIFRLYFMDNINVSSFLGEKGLSENLIDSYLESKGEKRIEIEKHVKSIVISDMKLEEWSQYLEEIKISIERADSLSDNDQGILVSLNLSKNLGVLGIYKLEDKKYLLTDQIENLTGIKKVRVEANNKNKRMFLVIEELLDERIGAYFTDEFVRIFTDVDGEFKEVFRQSVNYEAYYYEKWIRPSIESSKWFKLNEKAVIDYKLKENKEMTLKVDKNLLKSEGLGGTNNSIAKEFKEVEKREFHTNYIWDEKYKSFIIGKAKILANNEEVAIIENIGETVDSLLNLDDKYYKVINRNMQITYAKEDELEKYKDK